MGEAVEVHLNAGDALLFVDCMLHGSARRVNPGERRIFIARCECLRSASFSLLTSRVCVYTAWVLRSLAHLP